MKKRLKLLTGLTAGTMALGLMCFGFAQWSTDITLDGTVSANGKWDVSISDAAVVNISKGTAVDAEVVAVEPTCTVTVYDLKLHDLNNGNYIYQIDDINGKDVTLTKSEFEAYDLRLNGIMSDNEYTSGKGPDFITYYVNYDETYIDQLSYFKGTNGINYNAIAATTKNTDNGQSDGTVVGSVIAWCCNGFSTETPSNENIKLTWKSASDELSEKTSSLSYPASISEDKASAKYANVEFSLSGAWAEYSVTVTNNGTANANLSDFQLEVELAEPYTVDLPTIDDNEVLKPGESCTLNFVVSVESGEESFEADNQAFTVQLKYVQDTVEPAPSASHTHI